MRILWTPRALRDLANIRSYIARDNPGAARRWVTQLEQRANEAALAPKAGRMVPELERKEVREVVVRAYRIVYQVVDDGIHVLTVFEGHRLLPSDFELGG